MFAARPKMESSSVCFLLQYSHLLKNFSQFVVIHEVKDFGIVNKEEVDILLQLCLCMTLSRDQL